MLSCRFNSRPQRIRRPNQSWLTPGRRSGHPSNRQGHWACPTSTPKNRAAAATYAASCTSTVHKPPLAAPDGCTVCRGAPAGPQSAALGPGATRQQREARQDHPQGTACGASYTLPVANDRLSTTRRASSALCLDPPPPAYLTQEGLHQRPLVPRAVSSPSPRGTPYDHLLQAAPYPMAVRRCPC